MTKRSLTLARLGTHKPALMMMEVAFTGKPKMRASSVVSRNVTFFPSAFSSGNRLISGTL